MSDLHLFLQHLKQPEYLHILLNPLPVYGMAAGALILLAALVMRKEPSGALLWLAFMGAVTWFVFRYGHGGYDRVFAMSNADAQQWLDVHMHRAETWEWLFFSTGLAAFGALLTGKRLPAVSRRLSFLALALALASAALGGWIAQAGGQVRHSEFREGPPNPHHRHAHEHQRKQNEKP
jgi:hypothetical protein